MKESDREVKKLEWITRPVAGPEEATADADAQVSRESWIELVTLLDASAGEWDQPVDVAAVMARSRRREVKRSLYRLACAVCIALALASAWLFTAPSDQQLSAQELAWNDGFDEQVQSVREEIQALPWKWEEPLAAFDDLQSRMDDFEQRLGENSF